MSYEILELIPIADVSVLASGSNDLPIAPANLLDYLENGMTEVQPSRSSSSSESESANQIQNNNSQFTTDSISTHQPTLPKPDSKF